MTLRTVPTPLTINELLIWSKEWRFGATDWDMESRILLAYVLGKNSAELIAHGERILSAVQIDTYQKIVSKRQQGVPIAYLIGSREFWSLPIIVTEQVLIPRQETETLVERVLRLLDGLELNGCSNTRILELGTGSGAIALALASELPDAKITATDNSETALAVARGNQLALGLGNIEFLYSDWFAHVATEKHHLICSNPPYLSADDEHLQRGDLRFEPREALVAGGNDADGYAAITHIITHAKIWLDPSEWWGGWLVLEHGFEQGQGVRQLLSAHGYGDITTYQDLSGNDRVTVARAH